MDIRKLQRVIIDGLEDIKAQDIKVFNTSHLTELFERVIVASGTSNRQTRALASSVREKVKAAGGEVISTEGDDVGEWVLVDCGDAVVHILQPALRQYYNLEELWGDKPVRVKLGDNHGRSALARPSEPLPDADDDLDGLHPYSVEANEGESGNAGQGRGATRPATAKRATSGARAARDTTRDMSRDARTARTPASRGAAAQGGAKPPAAVAQKTTRARRASPRRP